MALTSPSSGFQLVTLGSAQNVSSVQFGIRNLATGDFGDLPDSYRTTSAVDGPRHEIISGFRLGARIDGEIDGQPTADATGDDFIFSDEDGVVLVGALNNPTGVLVAGTTNVVQATVFGIGGYLNAWMDFNRDGDFNDLGEHVPLSSGAVGSATIDLDINPGTHSLKFSVPSNMAAGPIPARFRWGTEGLDYFGTAIIGEVEDYLLANINPAPVVSSIPGDYDNSQTVDMGDYNLWKSTYGEQMNLAADGSGNGIVDAADFSVWRDHMGQTSAGGGSGGAASSAGPVSRPTPTYGAVFDGEFSPAVIANLEAWGYVPVTLRVGLGTRTVYMLPDASPTPGSGGSTGSAGSASGDFAARQAFAARQEATSRPQSPGSFLHFVGQHGVAGRHGRTADAAAHVDSALLLLAASDANPDQADQDDDFCPVRWGSSADHRRHGEAIDEAITATFDKKARWRKSLR